MKKLNKTYWKGTEELRNDPEFVKHASREFSENLPIKDAYGDNTDAGPSRRDFLKLMGFSVAAVSLAACETPVKNAIPYLNQPEEIVPGVPNYYASTYSQGGDYCSVLVKTREGRPIFIEGNNLSSLTKGKVNARVSASVLNLYDEERAKEPTKKGEPIEWKKADEEIRQALQRASGTVYIVSNTIISPSTKRVIKDFAEKYNVKHVTYDPVSAYGMLEANRRNYGKAVIPHYDFSKAEVIVGVNADFLGHWISDVEFNHQYAQTRKVSRDKIKMSRHYQFEPRLSMTGANADYRVPFRPSEEGFYVATLYNAIAQKAGQPTLSVQKVNNPTIVKCADDLWKARGKSLVVSGSNDVNIQLLVNGINKMLGNYGKTLDMSRPSYQRQGNDKEMMAFVEALQNGNAGGVIFYGANPVYDHPMGAAIADNLSKAKFSISTADRLDETASLCTYNTPDKHYLESWDDAEPKKGFFSLTQPTIRTIFNTRQAQDSFLTWAGMDKSYQDYIKETWKAYAKMQSKHSDMEAFWKHSLHDGVFEPKSVAGYQSVHEGGAIGIKEAIDDALANDNAEPLEVVQEVAENIIESNVATVNWSQVASEISSTYKTSADEWQLVVYSAPVMGSGAQANNPWLQETPDPIAKVCWGNFIAVPENKAMADMGFVMSEGKTQFAKVLINGQEYKLPVVTQPGMPPKTAAVAIGYGRGKEAGKVAAEAGGANAFRMLNAKNGLLFTAFNDIDISNTGEETWVAQTQTHDTIMGRRTIIQEALLSDYKADKLDRYDPKIATSEGKVEPTQISVWDVESDGFDKFKGESEKEFNSPEAKAKAEEIEKLTADQWNKRNPAGADMHEYPIHHWGMSIDLNSCTGCSACIVACSLENNVPVVGKQEVYRRREMHWLRIDRYYSSKGEGTKNYDELEQAAENPEVVFQPMMCQHCNNAPCETVCPVAATTHSSEGLNQMTYNRCVGTKYCANNCPYKVRRFNWFKYHNNDEFDYHMNNKLGRMVLNPDVTVRSRGVMEKCSLCVQRIQSGKLQAKKERREMRDGEVQTACASACPTEAITFGDLNLVESQVNKTIEPELEGRAYNVLSEINTRPNVWYMMKIRNQDQERESTSLGEKPEA